jgi:hypothetical protein
MTVTFGAAHITSTYWFGSLRYSGRYIPRQSQILPKHGGIALTVIMCKKSFGAIPTEDQLQVILYAKSSMYTLCLSFKFRTQSRTWNT